MEDDASVRKLVELIFSSKFKNIAEVTAPDLSIPSRLITGDFPQRLQSVLFMKHMIFNNEWRRYVGACSDFMLSSDELYLKCVMFACLNEYKCYRNVFESFIGVCALLKLFNDGILTITGMDFRDLNTEVFMVVYENVMKSTFCEEGGFQQLVEYIRGHRYLSWNWNWKDLDTFDDPASVMIQEDLKKEVEKEKSRRDFTGTDAHIKEINAISIFLVQKVLSSTSVELPNLPNTDAKIKCLEASKNEEMKEKGGKERVIEANEEFVDLNAASQGCSSSSSDSNTDPTINQNWDEAKYERIIQAVIRLNRSRNSDHTNLDNPIRKEADGISEHLIDKIKSLKIVLDDYDKE